MITLAGWSEAPLLASTGEALESLGTSPRSVSSSLGYYSQLKAFRTHVVVALRSVEGLALDTVWVGVGVVL